MLKILLLGFGILTLAGIIWHIGVDSILTTASLLGPQAIGIIFLPLVVVYALEAFGWHLTLGNYAERVGFFRLFAIRMAGETVNVTTPAAYVGGEPLKAYILKRYGVPMVEGLASVVTAKTAMTIAQVMFILLGVVLAFWLIGTSDDYLLATIFSVGLLVFGLVLFVSVQRYGLAMGFLRLLELCRIRLKFLEKRRSQLMELDQTIREFYRSHRRTFYFSLVIFFIAWFTETLEVYAILYFLGAEVDLLSSISIAALTILIKGGTFFIPGSLGAQEGGYVLLLVSYGYSDVTGITFALVRRLREIVWILVGLLCLILLKGREAVPTESPSAGS